MNIDSITEQISFIENDLQTEGQKTENSSAKVTDDISLELAGKELKISNQFLLELSERIRSYLNAISGFAELVTSGQLNDEQRQYIREIDEASRNAVSLLNDAVFLWRIKSGQFDTVTEKCNIEQLLTELLAIMQPQAAKRKLSFAITKINTLPGMIHCDRKILRECLNRISKDLISSTIGDYVCINVSVESKGNNTKIRFDFVCSKSNKPSNNNNRTNESFFPFDESGVLFDGKELWMAVTESLAKSIGGEILWCRSNETGSELSLIVPTNQLQG